MSVKEKAIESRLTRAITISGGKCYKLESNYCRGMPDRMVLFKGRVWFIELKTRNGKISASQEKRHKDFKQCGIDVIIIRSKEEVDAFVKRISS